MKQKVLLNRTPSSTQLHPAPSISAQLISTPTQLHLPPASSYQSPASSLQPSEQYSNWNIARNWAISPNLGRKIQSWPFCLNIGTHDISRMLILILTLIFWIFSSYVLDQPSAPILGLKVKSITSYYVPFFNISKN